MPSSLLECEQMDWNKPLPKPLAFLLRWTVLLICLALILSASDQAHRAWIGRTAGPVFDNVGKRLADGAKSEPTVSLPE